MYAVVNIAGLTLGIVSCILIGLYIVNQLSYDRFNVKADRIVRVTMSYGDANQVQNTSVTGNEAGPQLKLTFPQVKSYVRIYTWPRVVKYGDKMFDEKRILYADSTFFNVFSFHLLQGNPATVLSAPQEIVITKAVAKKYFGDQDPVGKTLQIGTDPTANTSYTVTGIVADAPAASQIKFDFIASFSSLTGMHKRPSWFNANYYTYLLLHHQDQIAPLQKQINTYMKEVSKNELGMTGSEFLKLHLEPLLRVHLYSHVGGLEPDGSITTIYILGAIALLILFIACINYINLATAYSAGRGLEIAIRKVFGAERKQLFLQFIGESFLLTVISFVLAIAIAVMVLPLFVQLTGIAFTAGMIVTPLFILLLWVLCLAITFVSGSYPALILTNTGLAKILKSGVRLASSGGNLRKSLIVFQFVVSVFLIISTLIILLQLSYVRNKNLGYNKNHIIVLPVDYRMRPQYDAFKKAIENDPQIVSVTGAYESPVNIRWGDGIDAQTKSGKASLNVNALPVDLGFIKTMDMHLVAGTAFTPADLMKMDTSDNYKNYQYSFILNETAVHKLGWTPEEAIGKTILKGRSGIIKGVVKDFNFASLHQPIGPLVIFLGPEFTNEMFVKIKGNNIPATIDFLHNLWKEWAPYRPFEYHFLNDEYNNLYKSDQRTGKIFTIFSILAILLACLGLLALAAYTTVQRTKEIGIRKVLGASVISITTLISKDFLKLVIVAIVIAVPLGWIAMHQWLQNFAYKIHIHWWVFVIAGLVSVFIALMTVSFQAIKAAVANPVEALRSE
jgi:putative ABC transport system permease protein